MLYITYNNTDHTDGAGAQMQRIISIRALADYLGIIYIHSDIQSSTYLGLKCLEENKENSELVPEYNKLIHYLEHQGLPEFSYDRVITAKALPIQKIQNLMKSKEAVLLRMTYAHPITNEYPQILDKVIPAPWIKLDSEKIIIAVHVRRGELLVVDSDRMLPNSWYIECIKALENVLQGHKYEFHIHTENVTQTLTILPSAHGIMNRIEKPVVINPNDISLDDFTNVSEHLIMRVNEHPVRTFQALANSHILVASRSSFSYVAGLINDKHLVITPPYYNASKKDWITINSPSQIAFYRDKILTLCS